MTAKNRKLHFQGTDKNPRIRWKRMNADARLHTAKRRRLQK